MKFGFEIDCAAAWPGPMIMPSNRSPAMKRVWRMGASIHRIFPLLKPLLDVRRAPGQTTWP